MQKSELMSQMIFHKVDEVVEKHGDTLSLETIKRTITCAIVLSTITKAAWYSFLVYLATLFSPVAAVVVGLIMFYKTLGLAAMHKLSMKSVDAYFESK